MDRATLKDNPEKYHQAMCGLLKSAFKIKDSNGYQSMRDVLRNTQFRGIVLDFIEKEKGLTEAMKERCIINTLIDMHNESAEALGLDTIQKEDYDKQATV